MGEKSEERGILIEIGRWYDPRSGRTDQTHLGAKVEGARARSGDVREPEGAWRRVGT